MTSRAPGRHSDADHRTDARHGDVRAAQTRADDARKRALAAREAAEQATTEYSRRAHERVADIHSELALSYEDHARTLHRADDGDEPWPVRAIETMRLDVERRMRRGERFADVEDAIDASDLQDQEKAALWLLGWSYVHPRAQRREALAYLEHLIAAPPSSPSHRRPHLRIAG